MGLPQVVKQITKFEVLYICTLCTKVLTFKLNLILEEFELTFSFFKFRSQLLQIILRILNLLFKKRYRAQNILLL